MDMSDIIYLTFLMILLFIILYKGFSFGDQVNQQEGQQFAVTRDTLYYNRHCLTRTSLNRPDRQGNAFPTPEDNSRESRYNDIFFIEPNSVEAARIRAQLEKDDKDLPSYEDVIRMTSVDPPNSALATMTASNASVNTTETILSVPPYSEVDPNASSTSVYAATALPTTPPPFEAASVVPITLSTASSSSVTHHSSNV